MSKTDSDKSALNHRLEEEYKKHWPKIDIDLQLITGAKEVGKDLFALGAFGGFGGHLMMVYPDKDWAIRAAKEWNAGKKSYVSVYRIRCTLEDEVLRE